MQDSKYFFSILDRCKTQTLWSILFLCVACGNTDPRKLGQSDRRDTSSFDTSVLGEWQGTLNEGNGTNLVQKGQVTIRLKKDDKFEATFEDRSGGQLVIAKAKGLYYIYGTDRIAFEASESDFYPHFSTQEITTMEMQLNGNRLIMRYEKNFGITPKVSEFLLRLTENRVDGQQKPTELDPHSSCSGVAGENNWIFTIDANSRFEAIAKYLGGSEKMVGDCQRIESQGSPFFRCLTKEASKEEFKKIEFIYIPTRDSNGKIVKKTIEILNTGVDEKVEFECSV